MNLWWLRSAWRLQSTSCRHALHCFHYPMSHAICSSSSDFQAATCSMLVHRLLLSFLFVFSNSTSSWYTLRTLRTLCTLCTLRTLRNYSSSPSYFCLDLIVGEHSYGCHGYSCVLIVLSCSWLLSLPFLLVVWCHCSFFTCSNVLYIFHFCNIPFKGALLKEVTQDYLFQPHYSSVGWIFPSTLWQIHYLHILHYVFIYFAPNSSSIHGLFEQGGNL